MLQRLVFFLYLVLDFNVISSSELPESTLLQLDLGLCVFAWLPERDTPTNAVMISMIKIICVEITWRGRSNPSLCLQTNTGLLHPHGRLHSTEKKIPLLITLKKKKCGLLIECMFQLFVGV